MPEHILFGEFRDQGIGTPYPFADTATLVATGPTTIQLDKDLFLDAIVYPIGGGPRLGLVQIEVADRAVSFGFGIPGGAPLCRATFDPLAPLATLPVADALARPAGLLICNPVLLAEAQSWAVGTYILAAGAGELAASCTIPIPAAGVRALATDDGSPPAAGDVWLVGERGVVIRPDPEDPGPHPAIRVDVVGDVLWLRTLCNPDNLFATPGFVHSINNIAPCPGGDFQLTIGSHDATDTIIRLFPVAPDTFRIEMVGKIVN
jgi:hypothetical protein